MNPHWKCPQCGGNDVIQVDSGIITYTTDDDYDWDGSESQDSETIGLYCQACDAEFIFDDWIATALGVIRKSMKNAGKVPRDLCQERPERFYVRKAGRAGRTGPFLTAAVAARAALKWKGSGSPEDPYRLVGSSMPGMGTREAVEANLPAVLAHLAGRGIEIKEEEA